MIRHMIRLDVQGGAGNQALKTNEILSTSKVQRLGFNWRFGAEHLELHPKNPERHIR